MDKTGYEERARAVPGPEIDRTPLTVMTILLALAAIQLIHHYPNMPEVMATHFGPSGLPDAWTNKNMFFVTYGAIEVVIVAMAFFLAKFGSRLPTGALNIPNKDYWLAPERRAGSLRFVWGQILWLEAATLAFLLAVAEVVFRTNLGGDPAVLPTPNFAILLVIFVVVTGWLSLRILLRFRRPSDAGD
jgi:uncharacterized membrane protein